MREIQGHSPAPVDQNQVNQAGQTTGPVGSQRSSFQERMYRLVLAIFEVLGNLRSTMRRSINGTREPPAGRDPVEFNISGPSGFREGNDRLADIPTRSDVQQEQQQIVRQQASEDLQQLEAQSQEGVVKLTAGLTDVVQTDVVQQNKTSSSMITNPPWGSSVKLEPEHERGLGLRRQVIIPYPPAPLCEAKLTYGTNVHPVVANLLESLNQ